MYENHHANTSSNSCFSTITELNISLFFSKNIINWLHNGTKTILIHIVNTYNRDFRKKIFFICFTSKFQGVTNTFDHPLYVNSELTYVRSESISLPNWHMSDQNLYQFRTDICQIRIYVTSELTYVRSEFSMIYESSCHFASALFSAYVKLLDICMHTKIKLCWKGYQYLH